ncbi:MAG: DUF2334 domain-containing protein [Clostridium sp.]|nr:DUF2334 domain-containing protein [Clostridium sp.]
MSKFTKKIILLTFILASVIFLSYILFNSLNRNNTLVTVKNNVLTTKPLEEDIYGSSYNPSIDFESMPVSPVSNITFNILSHKNITDIPVISKAQRYYIPLSYISKSLHYNLINKGDLITLTNKNDDILLTYNTFTSESFSGILRGNLLTYNNEKYICISDIEQIFNLTALFDFTTKTVTFVNNDTEKKSSSNNSEENSEVALIRLEDFTAGDSYMNSENMTKVKCMADYLYSSNIKFHIAWISHFKAPTDNIDNDLLKVNNIANVAYVNLLDYMINKGGEVGLHGYTHQNGDGRSAVSTDLSKDVNNTEEETATLIENAINTASALNIPVHFFESAHYTDTPLQQQVIKKYFKYAYEPFNYENNAKLYRSDDTLFIPTPLGFVEHEDPSPIINDLNSHKKGALKSFFYHPSIEMDYVNFTIDNNTLYSTFNSSSPLVNLIHAIKENNYTTVYIDELTD